MLLYILPFSFPLGRALALGNCAPLALGKAPLTHQQCSQPVMGAESCQAVGSLVGHKD